MTDKIQKYPALLTLLLFLAAEVLINPLGNFPLNDDWTYAKEILNFNNSGKIKFSDWHSTINLVPFFCGILLTKIFGFSFTLLRFFNIFLMICSVLAFDRIQKCFKISGQKRLLGCLLFLFNPLTLSLCNTFMPDMAVLFFSLLSFLFVIRYMISENKLFYILFVIASITASFCRQTAVIIPLVFSISWIIYYPKSIQNTVKAILPFILNLLLLATFQRIAIAENILGSMYNYQFYNIISALFHPSIEGLKHFLYYFTTSTLSLGIFILPLTASAFRSFFKWFRSANIIYSALFTSYFFMLISRIALTGNFFPFAGNILYHIGIGPVIMSGFDSQASIMLSPFWKITWLLISLAGGLSFCVFAKIVFTRLKSVLPLYSINSFALTMLVLLVIFYLFPICLNYANDRYLLFLLPFCILIFFISCEIEIKKLLFYLLLIPVTIFSVLATHDYMSINSARWQAGNYLTEDLKISSDHINGGFEFNGWYTHGMGAYDPSHKGTWWWVVDDTYTISPVIKDGCYKERAIPFSRWLHLDHEMMYVLKKK
jgi:hypothetical protein